MKYKLQDLIDIDHFQNLQDRLNKIYAFPSAIIDNDGNILTATAWQDVCAKFHRKNKEAERICIKSDQYILSHVEEAKPALSYRCPHGLMDNATPIIIDGIHYGNFFTGQFFLEEPDLDFFRAQAKKYGFDEEAYIEAVNRVPVWTQEQLDNYLFFIKGLIAVISESGLKTIKEIENKKRIERSEKRYRSFLKAATDGFWVTDTNGRLLEVNDAYCQMSGYSEDELLSMHIFDLEVIETPDLVAEHMQKVISKGSDRFETKHRRKDGSVFDIEVSIQFRPEDAGQCVCFLRDITDKKRADQALRESEERYRQHFSQFPVPIFVWKRHNDKFMLTGYNEAADSITDSQVTKLIGITADQLYNDDDSVHLHETLATCYQERRTIRSEFEYRLKTTGQKKCISGTWVFVAPDTVMLHTEDITERKRTEKELFRSEQQWRAILSNTPQICVALNTKAEIVFANTQFLKITGWTEQEVIGKNWFETFIPETVREGLRRVFEAILDQNDILDYSNYENDILTRTGELRSVAWSNVLTKDARGDIVKVNCLGTDLTDHKRTEMELRNRETQYRMLVENQTDLIVKVDLEGRFLFVSPSYCRMFNKTEEELMGNQFMPIVHEDDRKSTAAAMKSLFVPPHTAYMEQRALTKDGWRWLGWLDTAVLNADGVVESVIGVGRDITDRKLADRELQNLYETMDLAQKMAGIGYWSYEIESETRIWSAQMYKNFGFDPECGPPGEKELQNVFHEDDWKIYKANFESAYEGIPYDQVARIVFPDGQIHYVHSQGHPRVNESGEIIILFGTSQDITVRIQAENELRKSEEKYRRIFENSVVGFFQSTPAGRFINVNRAFAKMLKYESPEDLIASVTDIATQYYMEPSDRQQYQTILQKEGQVDGFEFRARCKDGSSIWVSNSTRAYIDDKGKVYRYEGVISDITERKFAEEAQREIEAKLSHIVMGSPVPTFVIDGHHRITHWNKALESITGIFASEVIGTDKQWMAFYHEKRPVMADLIVDSGTEDQISSYYGEKIRESDRVNETYAAEDYFPHLGKEGCWLFFTAAPLRNINEDIIGAVEVLQDITPRKKFEQSLRESESRYRSLFESANDAILVLQNGRFFDCNPRTLTMFNCTREQIIGKRPHELSPDYQPDGALSKSKSFDLINKVHSDEVQVFQWQHQSFDGSFIDAEVNLSRLDLGGESYLLAIVRDVTERKRAEEAIRKSDERLKLALDSVSDAIWDWRVDTGEVYFSSRWYKMLEYEPYELPQEYETWKTLLHPEDRSTTEQTVLRHVQSGKPFEIEFRMRTKSSQWRWILARGKVVEQDAHGRSTRMLGTHMDITERKKMEERIQQTQKMESIGSLAGGIAHDFNNILFPIIGMAELLLDDLPPKSIEYENANQIYKAGLRGGELVKQILTFSRQSEHRMIPTRAQSVLKEVIKLSRSTIPSNINIQEDIQTDCGFIMADPTQIHQVAMNIITNAYHAVEGDGGAIFISLKETVLGATDLSNPDLDPNKPVLLLRISDTGCGIRKDLVDKIFDPYFTTKEQGKGTGLGLAVVHGIIQEHGGTIKVFSEIGQGSTFDIYLPVMEQTDTTEELGVMDKIPVGNEHILLVDDEIATAMTEKKLLERLGYAVTERTSSTDALNTFKENPDAFDLVITDMTMPNMTGDHLAKELKSIRSTIPVIICTGFSEKMSQGKAEKAGISGLLMKPVAKADMGQMVRSVLDAAKAAPME